MDEELKKALLQILEGTRDAASQGKEFVLEQAPLVVQEYVRYTLIASAICAAGLVLCAAVVVLGWRKVCRLVKDDDPDGGARTGVTLVSGVLFCALMAGAADYGFDALKAWVAPRVLILEKAAELVK